MRLRPSGLIVAGLLLASALGGCGDDAAPDPDPAEERARLVEGLAEDLRVETDGALGDEAATCVASALVDAVGPDRFDEIVAAASASDPELRDQVIDVFASCDALEPIVDQP